MATSKGSRGSNGSNHDSGSYEVFDIADWLDRATGRSASSPRGVSTRHLAYVPRHRADVPADSVA